MLKLTYFTLICAMVFTIAVAAPYQELPPRAGHVPVYIREGNTPLSEIHPKLVEAFPDDESVRHQVENKTPDAVTEETKTNDEVPQEGGDDKHEPVEADVAKVEEVTASDIAEFNDVKYDKANVESENEETSLEPITDE